jgi:hypothetical protein
MEEREVGSSWIFLFTSAFQQRIRYLIRDRIECLSASKAHLVICFSKPDPEARFLLDRLAPCPPPEVES